MADPNVYHEAVPGDSNTVCTVCGRWESNGIHEPVVVSGGAVSPENRSNEAREIAEQYLYDGDSDHPLNPGYYALLDVADSVAALESAYFAALARIAAVEAPQNVERLCEVMHDAYERAAVGAGWETQQASRKPWADVPEANKTTMRAAVSALLAALAASPTPTGPEPATDLIGYLNADPLRSLSAEERQGFSGPATPEPTEETP